MPNAEMDVLELTNHTALYREDLSLVQQTGISQLRYSAPWHQIERVQGEYNWSWMDEVMGVMRSLGIEPITDLIHHTSTPKWVTLGMADERFVEAYVDFGEAFVERYPWVTWYTVFNEPFVTTLMCGLFGTWPPHYTDPGKWIDMQSKVARTICLLNQRIRERVPGATLLHVDTCERHDGADAAGLAIADQHNDRRFQLHDLVLGRVDDNHPRLSYWQEGGLPDHELQWFRDNAVQFDVLGLDYYCHSEHEFFEGGSTVPSTQARGFAATAMEYVGQFPGVPVMLSETNIRGTPKERLSWLKHMVEQCEWLETQPGVDFRGFCWYPFIDSTDWDTLLTKTRGRVDPQGIYWLDAEKLRRNSSMLSDYYGLLARGVITSSDLPAYRFEPETAQQLAGHLKFMEHWEWRD